MRALMRTNRMDMRSEHRLGQSEFSPGALAACLLLLSACSPAPLPPPAEPPETLDGTWDGAITLESQTLPIRFVVHDNVGVLTGEVFIADPATGELLPNGELEGSRTRSRGNWTTVTDLEIDGEFTGDSFVGTLLFPAVNGEPSRIAELELKR